MKKSLGARTLVYPAPVFVIGSYDVHGKPDLMTASWGGICSSNPPCIAVSIRKSRMTYENIVERKAFTVSIPSEIHRKEVDFFGLVSGRSVDKFSATNLTPVKGQLVDAPYAKEFPMVLECKLLDTNAIGSHFQFVGEIIDVKLDEEFFEDEKTVNIEKLRPLLYSPANGKYYGLGKELGKIYSIGKDLVKDTEGH